MAEMTSIQTTIQVNSVQVPVVMEAGSVVAYWLHPNRIDEDADLVATCAAQFPKARRFFDREVMVKVWQGAP